MVPNFTKHHQIINKSSTYRFQKLKYSRKTGTMLFSSSTMKISARTGPSGDPIALFINLVIKSEMNVFCTKD